jgi:hypothetical protein
MLDLAQVFVDARTGERFVVAPTGMSVEVADTGSGVDATRRSVYVAFARDRPRVGHEHLSPA